MEIDDDDFFRLDRTAASWRNIDEEEPEIDFWLAQPVIRRFQTLEFLRQQIHGTDDYSRGLERVLELAELE